MKLLYFKANLLTENPTPFEITLPLMSPFVFLKNPYQNQAQLEVQCHMEISLF